MNYILQLLEKFEEELMQILRLSEELNAVKQNSAFRSPYEINIFDKYGANETDSSDMLYRIFKYKQDEEYIIVKKFAETYLKPVGFDISNINQPSITPEEWHIDISIREKNYAIIFENKIKNAVYQRNQLAKYIQKLKSVGYQEEQIYIVIFPLYNSDNYINDMRPSVWKCPIDWEKPNQERQCAWKDTVSCWCDDNNLIKTSEELAHCKKCINYREAFSARTVILNNKFPDWLLNDIIPVITPKETILISAIIQLSDFFKGLYHTRINNKLFIEMQEFIKKNILNPNASNTENWKQVNEKIGELDQLRTGMLELKSNIAKSLIEEWRKELSKEWKNIKYEIDESFGINIHGIWCGCWSGCKDNNSEPFWGFECDNEITEEQKTMITNILDEAGFPAEMPKKQWYVIWHNTLHGNDRCRMLYAAAKKLGYLE